MLYAMVALFASLAVACESGEPATQSPGNGETPATQGTITAPGDVPEGMEIVWETYSLLMQDYVDGSKVDSDVLAEAAVEGMIDALDDRYSAYIGPQTFELEQENFQGKFEGIGAHVEQSPDGNWVVVVAPLPDTPAEEAGIKAGDWILAVDGVDAEGWSVVEAVNRIRGPRGTPVTLTVLHVDGQDPVDITIVRGTIEQSSVYGRMVEDQPYGVVQISQFTAETFRETREAVQSLVDGGATGIVLDLRRNPGGLLTATVDVASEFLTDGLVTYEIDSRGIRDDWEVKSGGRFPDLPMVVLVDEFSASGSEVLAGALQDHGRAIIIGTQTFGKGSVNLMRGLSNGGGVYLTTAHWYTPNGRLLEEKGVSPDVVVELPEDATEDLQLNAAIQQLEFELSAAAAALP